MINLNLLTTGEKIKNFRKRIDLSQLELETAIAASPGSVSRIEAGKVNPTKETILQLGKVLKLTEKEISDLLGVRPLLPTREEVQSAIEECKGYLDKEDVVAYLLDENGIVYYASLGFKILLSLTDKQVQDVLGKEILEIALSPQYGISKFLNFERNKRVLAIEAVRISQESNIAEEYLREVFIKIPLAQEVMALAQTVTLEEVLSNQNKHVYFDINDREVIFSYSRERLKRSPRFEIIEYFKSN